MDIRVVMSGAEQQINISWHVMMVSRFRPFMIHLHFQESPV